MSRVFGNGLSRRERQIVNVLYEKGRATAADVCEALPDAPSYSAVRALLRILEDKGHIRHERDGLRYVYLPTAPRQAVAGQMMQQVVQTFFAGSVEQAVTSLISESEASLTDDELSRLEELIRKAREGEPLS